MKQQTKIGYIRTSTRDQNLDLQRDALKEAGCTRIYEDQVSGTKKDRPGLTQALDYLRPGDVLVVWRLDRLGRSLKHLIEVVNDLEEKNIGFCSLKESIDTTSSTGRLIFHLFGSLAQFEREIIKERCLAGMEAAKAKGKQGGRPMKMSKEQVTIAKALLNEEKYSIKEVCSKLGVGRTTLYRHLNVYPGKKETDMYTST